MLTEIMPGNGFGVVNRTFRAFNRLGADLSKGALGEVNYFAVGAETDSLEFGVEDSIWANMLGVIVDGYGVYAVALEDIADDTLGRWQLMGDVREALIDREEATLLNATWTEATLTLTLTGAFSSYTFTAGDEFEVFSGTGATPGFYAVASKVDNNNITLATSIGAAADGQTNIRGFLRKGAFAGLSLTASITGNQLTPAVSAAGKTVGIMLDDLTGTARLSGRVLFNGLYGFGAGS